MSVHEPPPVRGFSPVPDDPTEIVWDEASFALAVMVRRLLPTLTYRHHGIGLLQAYLAEGEHNECRVHLWDPRLEVPGKLESGGSHNHRFHMTSHVLLGAVHHTFLLPTADREGFYSMAVVNPARSVLGGEKGSELVPLPGLYSITGAHHVIVAGQRYTFAHRAFHCAIAKELTITLVTKTGQEAEPARVLLHRDADPVFAVGAPDPELQALVVREACERLDQHLLATWGARS